MDVIKCGNSFAQKTGMKIKTLSNTNRKKHTHTILVCICMYDDVFVKPIPVFVATH